MNRSIKGSVTERNVALAFANESMTVSRYSFFSKIALEEGLNQVGNAFSEIAEDEKRHAEILFRLFEGGSVELVLTLPMILSGNTSQNIANSIKVENAAWSTRYPEFAKIAGDEGFPEIAGHFEKFAKDEKSHENRLKILLNNVITR
jgi:rubrerythrin